MDILGTLTGAKSAIITGVVCVAICLPLGYCEGYKAADAKAQAQIALANAEAVKKAKDADEVAAVERVSDALENAKAEQELTDAIVETPDTVPDAVRVQLGCERLRRAGVSDLPAPCRPSGSDGAEARPAR